jgi:hypothetical protein
MCADSTIYWVRKTGNHCLSVEATVVPHLSVDLNDSEPRKGRHRGQNWRGTILRAQIQPVGSRNSSIKGLVFNLESTYTILGSSSSMSSLKRPDELKSI